MSIKHLHANTNLIGIRYGRKNYIAAQSIDYLFTQLLVQNQESADRSADAESLLKLLRRCIQEFET